MVAKKAYIGTIFACKCHILKILDAKLNVVSVPVSFSTNLRKEQNFLVTRPSKRASLTEKSRQYQINASK